jgi:NADPH-dependent curcumin reductase CurA
MSADHNRQLVLRRRPEGLPQPSDFELREGDVPSPGDGEVLVKTLLLSIDPAMRGWVADTRNYSEPVAIDSVMRSFGVARVEASRNPDYATGDLVVGAPGWQEWAALGAGDLYWRVDPEGAPLSASLGVLGITGLTAYVGMLEIGRPQATETVVVSTAAGAVGSVAGQLAAIAGARVVGITGSEAKRRICIDEFGFDECLNYRAAPDLAAAIAAACPGGVDVYFDSVGGAMLDGVLEHVNVGARIAICGTISQLPGQVVTGPRVERRLLVQRALMQGFLATDHFHRADEITAKLAEWLHAGRLRHREHVYDALPSAPDALADVLAGRNLGKAVVRVADGDA